MRSIPISDYLIPNIIANRRSNDSYKNKFIYKCNYYSASKNTCSKYIKKTTSLKHHLIFIKQPKQHLIDTHALMTPHLFHPTQQIHLILHLWFQPPSFRSFRKTIPFLAILSFPNYLMPEIHHRLPTNLRFLEYYP